MLRSRLQLCQLLYTIAWNTLEYQAVEASAILTPSSRRIGWIFFLHECARSVNSTYGCEEQLHPIGNTASRIADNVVGLKRYYSRQIPIAA